jgi:hypothetical protein
MLTSVNRIRTLFVDECCDFPSIAAIKFLELPPGRKVHQPDLAPESVIILHLLSLHRMLCRHVCVCQLIFL